MSNKTYATFWNEGKITTDLVQRAIAAYRSKFSQPPAVIVAGAHREDEAKDAATACGLAMQTSRGLLAGEFWLGQE